MFHEGDTVDVNKCKEILEKTEPQKSDSEKEYIKNILKQTTLFKQFEEEIKFQIQENEDLNISDPKSKSESKREILDIEILLNRTQRNIKYLRIPLNQFLFHKGEVGDKLYIIIKGHAAVYAEREKSFINQDLNKEKNLMKQISHLKNKILHYEHTIEQKEKKIQDDIQFEQQLIQQQQQQQQEPNEEIENQQINLIRKQQRKQEEQALAQMRITLCELKEELQNYQKQVNNLIQHDQEILKSACQANKDLLAKYFTSTSTSGNISYYQKLKTLDPFNHLGEASILTNENRTATVMACLKQRTSSSKSNIENADFAECITSEANVDTEESFQQKNTQNEEEDEDLHLFYLEANTFVNIFSSTLDQINYPLTVLSKILNQTSKDLIVRISYLFKSNEYKFNKQIFTEGVDLANCVYLIKRGSVQLQRNVRQEEQDNQSKNEDQAQEETENLRIKNLKKAQNNKRQIVIAVIGEGQFFGLEDISFNKKNRNEQSIDAQTEKVFDKIKKRTCSAVALTNCLVYVVPKSLLVTSSYQFYELQQMLFNQSQVKQQFYLNQAQKNNKIQHYMEQEINRIQQEPLIEKTIIQMSMNHHKQMMNGSKKISNMMDTYIKQNKDVLNNQKSILQQAHVVASSLFGSKQEKNEFDQIKSASSKTSPVKNEYGRIKYSDNKNCAEIIYTHIVQSENEKALNIKDNVVLSVMPQSQKNVKDILIAQKNYSKSKDQHNLNIRLPSRQNLNDTVFISQSTNNLFCQQNNFDEKQAYTEYKSNVNSLCEIEEIQPKQQYKIERKNNIIQVKKIKNINSQNSQVFAQDQEQELNSTETQRKLKQIKSLGSIHFSSPLIKPSTSTQNSENKFKYLKQIQSSFSDLNTPPIGPLQFDCNSTTTFHLDENQEKSKGRINLFNAKSIDLDTKKSFQSIFLPKQLLSNKNSLGNLTERIDKNISANQTQNSAMQAKFIQLRSDFDNLSSSQNDSFSKSDFIFPNTQSTVNTNKLLNNYYNKFENSNLDKNAQTFSINQILPDRNSNKKSTYFKQTQNDPINSEQQSLKSVTFFEQTDQNKKQGQLRHNHRVFSVGQIRKEEQNKHHSPFQIQALSSNISQKKQPQEMSPTLQQQDGNEQTQQTNIFTKSSLLQIDQNVRNKKKVNLFLSSSNLESQEYFYNPKQNEGKDQIFQNQFRNNNMRLSNESRFNNTFRSPQKFTPSKNKNGKLRPLLPLLSPQQINPSQQVDNFNPFQQRRLQPSRVKLD